MITIIHTTMMLGLILLPLLSRKTKKDKPVVYKIDQDTSNAHYAINSRGYLEEASGDKVSTDRFID